MSAFAPHADVATPPGGGRAALIFKLRLLPWVLARLGIWLARRRAKPFRFGKLVIAARHRDVREVLSRDLDFLIAPVNAGRFDAIGYRFILGMDRGDELVRERRILYGALHRVDMAPLRAAAADDIAARLATAGETIDAIADLARPAAAATARRLFGIAPEDIGQFMNVSRAIFHHCFLNIGGDTTVEARALRAARLLDNWFAAEIAKRQLSGDLGDDMMGQLLADKVEPDLIRRTLGGMLVGSIDTTATVVAKVMTVLLADPARLSAATTDADDPARLYGWCNEALRRWTQTPVLGRSATGPTTLSGVSVPAGAKVLLWTQAAMLDPEAFPHPLQLRPDRPEAAYLHLGGGLHPCAGRAINAWQIPMIVGALLRRSPRTVGRIDWAGPFPARLPLTLGRAT